MTISPKFWLIGYILIGFSYLREKIATSGHLFHFYRSITKLCGQDMAKTFIGQILLYPQISNNFPKGQHWVNICQAFGRLQMGGQDWWGGTLM